MSHKTPFIPSAFSSPFSSFLSLFLVVAAFSPAVSMARTSDSWLGLGSKDPLVRLAVTPVEIRIEAPTPLSGNNLELLLAVGGLGELREKANREFSEYLDHEVQRRFGAFFEGERVHLVDNSAPMTLHTNFDIAIRQKILDIFSGTDYDLEKGTMSAYGKFHYRLQGATTLREGTVDLSKLKLSSRYRSRVPRDAGIVTDTTREATERLLAEIAEEVLDEVEDILEAKSLLELARR